MCPTLAAGRASPLPPCDAREAGLLAQTQSKASFGPRFRRVTDGSQSIIRFFFVREKCYNLLAKNDFHRCPLDRANFIGKIGYKEFADACFGH
jgi:hypothetical protein